MLAEVAGKDIAEANAKETGKTKKQIIRDYLTGTNGRAKVEGWVPRWLRFPSGSYTQRGGVGSVSRTASAAEAMALSTDAVDAEPAPLSQAA